MHPSTTNFEKFETGNALVRKLIDRFFERIRDAVRAEPVECMLDAGCGEGMTFYQLGELLPENVAGFDINPECVAFARERFPSAHLSQEDIYNLPYEEGRFDLVLCMEVLEHLSEPEAAIRSLKRVASRRLIFSVPHEPWFRLGSLCRGKYLKTWGNHPEHVNHWTPASFERFLGEVFTEVRVGRSFPWIIAEARI